MLRHAALIGQPKRRGDRAGEGHMGRWEGADEQQGGRAHRVFKAECTSAVGVQNRGYGVDAANTLDVGGREKLERRHGV